MSCQCGTRAERFARWLGFRGPNADDEYTLANAYGAVRVMVDPARFPMRFALTVAAARLTHGRAEVRCG